LFVEEWQKQMKNYLTASWGLSPGFAERIATLYLYLSYYGLAPQIISGFRDPSKQAALRAQWDAGNRAGLQVRPSADSLHSRTDSGRTPAAMAIDISNSNVTQAGAIAEWLGLGWGGRFSPPDTHHFYARGGM